MSDFIHGSFDIIMEADILNLNTNTDKLFLSSPYHYDDPIANNCKKTIEQIVENQLRIDVSIYTRIIKNTVMDK